jgi:hypothetical protein
MQHKPLLATCLRGMTRAVRKGNLAREGSYLKRRSDTKRRGNHGMRARASSRRGGSLLRAPSGAGGRRELRVHMIPP